MKFQTNDRAMTEDTSKTVEKPRCRKRTSADQLVKDSDQDHAIELEVVATVPKDYPVEEAERDHKHETIETIQDPGGIGRQEKCRQAVSKITTYQVEDG